MSDISEFEYGIRDRQAAVVIVAIQCVRQARRDMLGTHGKSDGNEELYETMSQTRAGLAHKTLATAA